MSGIFLRRTPSGGATCAQQSQSWTLIEESEIAAAADDLRADLGLGESEMARSADAARGDVELTDLAPADRRTALALGSELARDPSVQAAVLDRLAAAASEATARRPRSPLATISEPLAEPEAASVCGGAAQLAAAASAEQIELLRREVDQLKRQLRVLLEDRAREREPPRGGDCAPLEAPGRCLAGGIGVATLLLTQCVFRRQVQQQRSTCSLAAAVGSCSAAVSNVVNCLATGPNEFVRDVRA